MRIEYSIYIYMMAIVFYIFIYIYIHIYTCYIHIEIYGPPCLMAALCQLAGEVVRLMGLKTRAKDPRPGESSAMQYSPLEQSI